MSTWGSIPSQRPCSLWSWWCTTRRSPSAPYCMWRESTTGPGCLTQIQTQSTHNRHRLDHRLWRLVKSTAHTRALEKKGTNKQTTFLVVYANQSFWLPGQPQYSTPSSRASIKVPVSTCSSDIILSLYFLWNSFDDKWVRFSCQHRPKPLPGKSFFLSQSSGGRAPREGSSSYYLHTFQERMLQSKINSLEEKCKKWKTWSSWRSWEWGLEAKTEVIYSSETHSWEGK